MGTNYYIYAEINNDQYLIGSGSYEVIEKWFDMLLHFKHPELAAIVHHNDYHRKNIFEEENIVNLKVYSNAIGIYHFVLEKKIVLGKNTHYINPYDQDTELYKLLSQHQERIQDEYIQEAIRIAKEGRDSE